MKTNNEIKKKCLSNAVRIFFDKLPYHCKRQKYFEKYPNKDLWGLHGSAKNSRWKFFLENFVSAHQATLAKIII